MQALAPLVTAMGIAQVVSWGTLFYAIGVLGPAMRKDLGVTELFLFGAFTAGLLVSGTLAPLVGRMVDRHGGRLVLSIGSVLSVTAMVVLALASGPVLLVAGCILAGAAMAASLYDPAFATLSQHTGARYRKAVTFVTIFGGFASTVFWPLSHILMQAWGWRITWALYAGFHLFLCLPIHLLFVPRRLGTVKTDDPAPQQPSPAFGTPQLRWLTVSFALISFTFSVLAVHLITLLTQAGLTPPQAVSIAMLVGPMQVVGRIIEFGFSERTSTAAVGIAAFALGLVALVALICVNGVGVAAILFVTAYGCANGVLTIVRGTAPAELFGRQGLGAVLGYLSRAGLYSRALAPASFSAMIAVGLTRNHALATLALLLLAGMGSYAAATRPWKRS